MASDEQVFSKILERYYLKLTSTEKRIADYILKHPHESVTFSVTNLAQKANTSETTVVRFARTLGFKGFLELKNELLKRASRDLATGRAPVVLSQEKKQSLECLVAESEMSNIVETVENLDSQVLQDWVERIRKCQTLYTLGHGMSSFLARIATYQMILIGKRSVSLMDSPAGFDEQLNLAVPGKDVLLFFSFPPYSSCILKTASLAREKGMYTCVITDRNSSPAIKHADSCLLSSNHNILPMNSLSSSLVIITTLLAHLAKDDPCSDYARDIAMAVDSAFPKNRELLENES